MARLREQSGWTGSNRDLDGYLWLAGQYRAWRKKPEMPLGSEIQRLFAAPEPPCVDDLAALRRTAEGSR